VRSSARAARRGWRGRDLQRDYRDLAARVDHARTPHDPQAALALARARPGLCLLGDCGIVPPAVLAVPTVATLNAHPGILPDYRGLDTDLWAILEDRFDLVGCTLHVVDPGIDTGGVLERRPHDWRGDETIDRLRERLRDTCLDLLAAACRAEWPDSLARAEAQGDGRYYSVMPMTRWIEVARKLRRRVAAR
jgi:methionyl-tRNA formyltransferase